MLITVPNDRYSKFFQWRTQYKRVTKWSLQIPPHLKCVACQMQISEIYQNLKQNVSIKYKFLLRFLQNVNNVLATMTILRSDDTMKVVVQRTKTVIGTRAFAVAAATVWNRLLADIRTSKCTIQIFAQKLKFFLCQPAHLRTFILRGRNWLIIIIIIIKWKKRSERRKHCALRCGHISNGLKTVRDNHISMVFKLLRISSAIDWYRYQSSKRSYEWESGSKFSFGLRARNMVGNDTFPH